MGHNPQDQREVAKIARVYLTCLSHHDGDTACECSWRRFLCSEFDPVDHSYPNQRIHPPLPGDLEGVGLRSTGERVRGLRKPRTGSRAAPLVAVVQFVDRE
jgi:hypothetical protein